MAEVTADAFNRENNGSKYAFPGRFGGMWNNYTSMHDVKVEQTVEGFKMLKSRLEVLYREYKIKELNIAAKHTENFINTIDKLIAMAEIETKK